MKREYLPRDEDAVSRNFVQFLENFYKEFPHLRTKRLFLTGESYAGMYIPYITQKMFDTNSTAEVWIGRDSILNDMSDFAHDLLAGLIWYFPWKPVPKCQDPVPVHRSLLGVNRFFQRR